MNAKMQMLVFIHPDNEHIGLQLSKDGEPLGVILLAGSDAEQHMSYVAGCRSKLSEQVIDELDPGSTVQGVYDPRWKADLQADGSVALFLRHVGYGWQFFQFPKHEARKFGEWLVKVT